MSVVGIDFGNLSMLIGQTSKGGVDVILNESSNRQTATCVSIQGKQRFTGDSAASMIKSNVKNTVASMKLLVGRQFDDPDVQRELKRNFFKSCKLPGGGVGIEIMYNDEPKIISAEHFMGMMLGKAKEVCAYANSGINLADAVMAVPFWFTESQRKGVLQAAEIADINCLKIANESTLIGLSYGIFKSAKKQFSETEAQHVMFIDIGYTGTCVTIIDFIQENMKVLATICDRELGGRDFDDCIIEFLAEQFQAKTKIDVRKTPKAILKLQTAAEKAKKTLSPQGVSEAAVNVECLSEDYDLNTKLTRDELESRSAHLVARFAKSVEDCLAAANLTKEQINETEIVGGSSRINIIKRTLGAILGLDASAMNYGLKTTMNADEAIARGGALQCAMVSSRMKVKPFNIVDKIPYGITASFQDEEDPSKETSVNLYERFDEIPHKPRRLTFRNKSCNFAIKMAYDPESEKILPPGENRFIGNYMVEYPSGFPPCDVRVTWNLDKNGFVYVQSAELMQEVKEEEKKEEPKEEVKKEEGKDGEEKKEEGKDGEEKKEEEKKEGEEGKEPEVKAQKKKYKKTELKITVEFKGLTSKDIKDSMELEASMAYENKLIVETADKRNELESYIYGFRDKMDGSLKTFGTAAEKDEMSSKLLTTEDWLYNEGFDASKQEYIRQLDDLKKIGSKIEVRHQETLDRPLAIEQLKKQIELCKSFASKYDDNTAHITEEERDMLRKEIHKTENWMYDQISKQGDAPPHVDPILTAAIINKTRDTLYSVSRPIMTKPKPAPVVPPKPKAEETKGDDKGAEGKEEKEEKSDNSAQPPNPPSEDKQAEEGEPMDQVKPDEGAK